MTRIRFYPSAACQHDRGLASVRRWDWTPNEFLHAGTVITLADSCAGMGCLASLPEEAVGFTTIELKTNFLATALEGTVRAESRLVHGGRTTQIWDATISDEQGKTLALFRCTQLLLYPAN